MQPPKRQVVAIDDAIARSVCTLSRRLRHADLLLPLEKIAAVDESVAVVVAGGMVDGRVADERRQAFIGELKPHHEVGMRSSRRQGVEASDGKLTDTSWTEVDLLSGDDGGRLRAKANRQIIAADWKGRDDDRRDRRKLAFQLVARD